MTEEEKKKTKKVVKAKKTTKPKTVEAAAAAMPVEPIKPKKEKPVKETGPKYYGTGRRKESIARVWLKPGTGAISVNDRPFLNYFCGRKAAEYQILRPFAATNAAGQFDVSARAYGGGVWGQAGAVALGIARALVEYNPDFRSVLRKEGLLTRDPRMKERKKYGLKRARRAFQYTKR